VFSEGKVLQMFVEELKALTSPLAACYQNLAVNFQCLAWPDGLKVML
jgi:hypothetical protein